MKKGIICFFLILAIGFVSNSPMISAAATPQDTVVASITSLHEETFLPWNGGGPRKFYLDCIYESLIYLDPVTDEMMPGLAVKWESDAETKVWTFYLRQGVQFHEGKGEMTAEDVKYSMERMIDDKSIAGPASQLRKLIDRIETPEKYKVIYYLKRRDPEFDRGYLSNGMPTQIVCKKYVEAVGDEKASSHPIGTGAYTLAGHKKGLSIDLTTVPGVENHWRVHPKFKNIKVLGVPEESTRVAMLKAGELDLAPVSYDSIDTLKSSGLKILSVEKNWSPVIRFGGIAPTNEKYYNPKVPWADVKVRQALHYAIDRESIVKNIFHGEATPAMGDVVCAEWFKIPAYPYDPGKAKQLLKEAGYPNGFKVTMKTCTTTPGAELPIIGQAVAMYWSAIGVDVKIIPSDWGTVRAEWTSAKLIGSMWTHRSAAWPSTAVGLMVGVTGRSPFTTYATEESERRVDELNNTLDPAKRSELIYEMGLWLREEAYVVGIAYANEPYGASQKLSSWPTIRLYATNLDQLK